MTVTDAPGPVPVATYFGNPRSLQSSGQRLLKRMRDGGGLFHAYGEAPQGHTQSAVDRAAAAAAAPSSTRAGDQPGLAMDIGARGEVAGRR